MDAMEEKDLREGQWIYLWGKHYRVEAIDGFLVQIVPAHRKNMKPHQFDWVLLRKVLKYGKPSGREG